MIFPLQIQTSCIPNQIPNEFTKLQSTGLTPKLKLIESQRIETEARERSTGISDDDVLEEVGVRHLPFKILIGSSEKN